MLTSVATALLLAASASHVAAGPVNSHHKQIARSYAQDSAILEDYTPYHVRYLALDCQDKHNTTFFDSCCHPLLRWQKLSDRPKECIPSASASSSAAAAEPTATPIDEDPVDDECEPDEDPEDCDDETSTTAPASTASTHVVVTTSYKAPEPTTYSQPEEPITSKPEPTTTKPATTRMVTSTVRTTSEAEPTTSAAPDNGSGSFITGGFATFFEQGGVAGACGIKHSDDDKVVAVDFRRYGNVDKVSDLCGKKVRITNTDNGKTVDAVVADACPSCVNKNCLDLSHGAYDAIGARVTGMLPIKYEYLD